MPLLQMAVQSTDSQNESLIFVNVKDCFLHMNFISVQDFFLYSLIHSLPPSRSMSAYYVWRPQAI